MVYNINGIMYAILVGTKTLPINLINNVVPFTLFISASVKGK